MKRSTVILILLLVFSNLGWFLFTAYSVLDHGVSYTYLEASMDSTDKMLDQAIIVANENIVVMSLADAQDVLESDIYSLKPFVKEGCLIAGGLCMEIGADQAIVRVKTE